MLVIDDEPLVVRALCRMIGGHEATVAASAREGLEQCRLRTFDRIFCDLSMPGGGGEAFYEGLRAGQPALMERVVFVTGGAATAEAHEFLQATRQPVLYKPFDAASVRARLG